MRYRTNIAGWERVTRVVAGALLMVVGFIGLHASLSGVLVACVGAVSVLTAVVGYCPACALAGRKPMVER